MEHTTIIAGFGGQGLLFAGHVLAQAAVLDDLEVSWLPSYGPEMRGGTASCTVIVADRPIGSPIVDAADSVVALNPPSLARFEPLLVSRGLLVVNTSLIEAQPARLDVEVVSVECTDLAQAAGDGRLVSMVALGALVARRPIVRLRTVRDAIRDLVGRSRPELVRADVEAFLSGFGRARLAEAVESRPVEALRAEAGTPSREPLVATARAPLTPTTCTIGAPGLPNRDLRPMRPGHSARTLSGRRRCF